MSVIATFITLSLLLSSVNSNIVVDTTLDSIQLNQTYSTFVYNEVIDYPEAIGDASGPQEDEAFSIEGYDGLIQTADQIPNSTEMHRLRSNDSNFAGYFSIPSAQILVPMYYCFGSWDADDPRPQMYTDRKNSAALLFDWTEYVNLVVADHVNQNFATLSQVKPGSTATIYWPDNTITEFICHDAGNGINNDIALIDQHGTNWNTWTSDLVAYTCISGNSNGVYITKWYYA